VACYKHNGTTAYGLDGGHYSVNYTTFSGFMVRKLTVNLCYLL